MLVIRRLFGTGTNCIAPSGLPLLLCLFPGLAPWAFLSRPPAGLVSRQKLAKGPSGNKVCILARAPGGQMRGAATQAMPVCIVEERQQSRYAPFAAAPLRAAARRPAGGVARSLHTAPRTLAARALPPGPGPGAAIRAARAGHRASGDRRTGFLLPGIRN